MKTKFANNESIAREWFLVDAQGQTLGRMASKVAHMLRGKHKPMFSPHADTGDFIVVINAKGVKVTGNKENAKLYWDYSGYPGGEHSINFGKQIERYPVRVIESAVKGMLPKGPLGRKMFSKLKIYEGNEHPHVAQNPKALTI